MKMDFIARRSCKVSEGDRCGKEKNGNILSRPSGRIAAPHFLRLPILCLMALCALAACKKNNICDTPLPPASPASPAEIITVTMPGAFDSGGNPDYQLVWAAGTSIRVYEVHETAGLVNRRDFTLESGEGTTQGTFALNPALQDGLVPGKEYIAVWMDSWKHSNERKDGEAAYLVGTYNQEVSSGSRQASSGDWGHIAGDVVLVSDHVAIDADRPGFSLGHTSAVLEFDISSTAGWASLYKIDDLTLETSEGCFVTGYTVDGNGGRSSYAGDQNTNRLHVIFDASPELGPQPVKALLLAVWDDAFSSSVQAEARIGISIGATVSKEFTLQPMQPGKVYRFDYALTEEPSFTTPDPWDGTSTRPGYLNEQDKIIYIARPSDLIWLMDNHDEYYGFDDYTVIQKVDLDLNNIKWGPIDVEPFRGTYEGGGHSIANLSVNASQKYSGLFLKISSATVRDLHIVSGNIVSTATHVGGICGLAENSLIEGCSNAATISGGTNNVGGICGEFSAPRGGTITCCLNTGRLEGGSCVGGIAGLCGGNSDNPEIAMISYCVNKGDIPAAYRAGGIFGDNTTKPITVMGCRNTGSVSGNTSYGMPGGIGGVTGAGYILSCYSTGLVTSVQMYLGGICGYTSGGTLSDNFWLIRSGGATYGFNNKSSTGCTAFAEGEGYWPDGDPAKGWGVVDGSHPGGADGYAWKSKGKWNAGNEGLNSDFPLLWWE